MSYTRLTKDLSSECNISYLTSTSLFTYWIKLKLCVYAKQDRLKMYQSGYKWMDAFDNQFYTASI